jgi:hypothetical protein
MSARAAVSFAGRHDGRSAADVSTGLGGGEPGPGASDDEVSFELGDDAEHVQQQPPRRGGGVDSFAQ